MANALTRLLFDPVAPSHEQAPARFRAGGDFRSWVIPAGVGLVALVIGLVGAFADAQRFFFAYLIAWVFCVSIAVGALFFLMINHVVKARWMTTIRRIPEAIVANFPLLGLAGLPVLIGMHDLFHWTHAELYAEGTETYDYLLAGKAPYFFFPFAAGTFPFFFVLRYVLYFAVFSYLGLRLYRLSVQNDTAPSAENTFAMRYTSAWGILVAGVLAAFASYDFLMSLDPHWFSTIFGVYFFAGAWLANVCLMILVALWFRQKGLLVNTISNEHLHDLGKWMFGFIVFWAYIFFSQYMLYWYANIPEETMWFLKREREGWETVTAALFLFHFVLPFLIMLPRVAKRIPVLLAVMAGWLLVMHWFDLFWMAMPALLPHGEAAYAAATGAAEMIASAAPAASNAAFGTGPSANVMFEPGMHLHVEPARISWIDLSVWAGLFGLFLAATLARFGRHAITPYNDPYFAEALRFENM